MAGPLVLISNRASTLSRPAVGFRLRSGNRDLSDAARARSHFEIAWHRRLISAQPLPSSRHHSRHRRWIIPICIDEKDCRL